MKRVIFFSCLCFVLLAGTNILCANNIDKSICNLTIKNTTKLKKEQTTLKNELIVSNIDNYFDVEEEFQSSEDIHENFIANNQQLYHCYNFLKFQLLDFNYYNKLFKIVSFICTNSNPLYISQRVLRI